MARAAERGKSRLKVQPKADDTGAIVGYVFHCPGCEHGHIYYVTGPVAWSFNGDVDNPTFEPSLLNTCEPHPDPKKRRCHLYVRNGRIEFCADCAHDWAGKSYEMPDR